MKVRGTAAHVAEKYMSLARDAQSSGDPVAAENYLQHAEHYNRIVMAAQAQFQQSQPQFRDNGDEGYDDDRSMNGRGRDRFDFNGEGRGDDEGDDRFDSGDMEDDRFRPIQSRQNEQGDRPRGPRPDRFERRDRPDYRDNRDNRDRDSRDNRDRPERFARQDEPQPEVAAPAPVEAAAPPPPDEPAPPPRRRRGRPPRSESGAETNVQEGEDTTTDGAAALAAFPD